MSCVYRTYPIKKRSAFGFFGNLSVTFWIILINLVVYFGILFLSISKGQDFVIQNIALTPLLILSGQKLWTLFTSMFAHIWFAHLFFNMFSLFFVGGLLERIIGRKRFFWLYIFSGILGNIFFVLSGLIFNSDISGLGASGALFGILGVLAVLVPYSRIYLMTGPLIVIVADVILSALFPGSSAILNQVANILILIMIFAMFSFNPSLRKISIPLELRMWFLPIVAIVPLVIIDFFIPLPIGNSAHIGGLVIGLIYGVYLRNKFPNKVKRLGMVFR